MSVWHREEDGTYVAEISSIGWDVKHPVTGLPVTVEEFRNLTDHVENEEIMWWYGTLADGTRVLIYND